MGLVREGECLVLFLSEGSVELSHGSQHFVGQKHSAMGLEEKAAETKAWRGVDVQAEEGRLKELQGVVEMAKQLAGTSNLEMGGEGELHDGTANSQTRTRISNL